jgi:hypothetical protein
MNFLGKMLFCLSIAGLGYVWRQDALTKTEVMGKIDVKLKQYQIENPVVSEKIYNVLVTLILSCGIGFLS